MTEAETIIDLLSRNTEELDAVITGLDGGYIPPKPGGDLLRDGVGVLPTGKNIHALDRKYTCSISMILHSMAAFSCALNFYF